MLKGLSALIVGNLFFAALPATTNYSLQSYGFGSGGTANSSTATYSLEGTTGELSGSSEATTNFVTKPGFIETEQANAPQITLTNPSSNYDKLHFVIDAQNNPSDALFEMQVCVGGTGFLPTSCAANGGTLKFLKNDDTLTGSLAVADYQTYAAWGGASGQDMIGLTPNTTYYIRALATQGQFTESAYGPSSNATTSAQSISFCLYTGASCGLGTNSIAFGNINVNTITNSPNNIGADLATNANNGGSVYIYSKNGGLKSLSTSYNITSATANLAAVPEGFGAQIVSIGQTSGGTFTGQSPFTGSSNNVGILSTSVSTLATVSSPIVGGHVSTQLQVKPAKIAKAVTDYSETLTLIAAGNW